MFGVRRRNVARYEAHVAKLDNRSGFIDLFWPGVLLVEQKSAGRDLKACIRTGGGVLRVPTMKILERRPDGASRMPISSGTQA